MDPGIMKFLEDDEDEHVHSGADVDAFTAALNRDIGGAAATASASESHADDGVLSHETAPAVPSTSGTQWQQFTSQKEEEHQRYQQQNQRQEEQHKQLHQPEGEQQRRTGEQPEQGKPIQQEQIQHNHLQQPEQNQHLELEQQQPQVLQQPQPQPQPQSQLPHQVQLQPQLPHQLQLQQPQLPQQVHIQQPQAQLPHQVQLQQPLQQPQQQLQQLQPQQSALNQVGSSTRRPNMASHSISFGSLIPMILPHISKEQSQRLQALYSRLRRNEVSKEDFLRATRNVVGDQMLVQAVRQMQLKQQTQSQSTQSAQPNQQQQQHSQSSAQQTVPQPNLHPQQLNQNLNQRNQRAPDYQLHSQTITSQSQADTSHSSLETNVQQSRQMGEPHPELTAQQMSQSSALNQHQVKHEVDRTVATFQPPNQQQHHHLQAPQTSYSLYGRGHGNYQSHAYPVGTSAAQPNAGKAIVQDSQTRQAILPQGGVQVQAGSSQLNTKAMGKYEISKVRSEPKRREDEERITRLQSGGASHLSGQPAISQQQNIWSTTLDKDQAASTGIPPSVIVKQEVIDPNNDQQHKGQTQQPITDMQSAVKGASHAVPSHELLLDQGQSLLHGQPQTEVVDHQSIKTSGIASTNTPTSNQPVGSAGLHFDHAVQVVQVPVATSGTSSTANLHHSLPMYGVPISGGHSPGISVQGQMRVQLPSTPSSVAGAQIRTPPKKPLVGQKKPFELTGPTTQLSSKKQKVAGGLLDQSIDQLNDVTAVSGVNLREEEEQLLSGPKEESRATEALRRVVQEEEEKLVLQKGPMRNKIAGIMAKCGIKNVSSDVERCLSMSVEERLRTMLSNLIRLSKQRVDLEKAGHKIALTSDVRRQILLLNKKAKEDWEKKQAEEAEKLRKLNEAENTGVIDGEKDEARAKAQRAQKEEDDKMRANAANVAARAAVGGDDMLSKWKMMAEQARQKREGASDGASNTSDYKEMNRKVTVGGLKSTGVPDHQEADYKGPNAAATGSVRTLGRNLGSSSQTKPVRTISLKDIIALLEREPQMSKSTLLYRLYERGTDCVTEKVSENRNNESIFP